MNACPDIDVCKLKMHETYLIVYQHAPNIIPGDHSKMIAKVLMGITFDLMEKIIGDFEINMLPLGKFLSTVWLMFVD